MGCAPYNIKYVRRAGVYCCFDHAMRCFVDAAKIHIPQGLPPPLCRKTCARLGLILHTIGQILHEMPMDSINLG